MTDTLQLAQSRLLAPGGLGLEGLDAAFSRLMGPGVDFGDLYFQHSRRESWSLEDGIVKDGSHAIEQGVGVRAVSGEKTGFAYSDDIRDPIEGKPQLPEAYRDYLLDSPIETHIVQIIESRSRPAPYDEEKRVRTRIDAGRTRGVRLDMLFYPANPTLFSAGRVVEVSDTDAIIDFRITSAKDAPALKEPVSTRCPDPGWALSRPSMP